MIFLQLGTTETIILNNHTENFPFLPLQTIRRLRDTPRPHTMILSPTLKRLRQLHSLDRH